MQDATDRAIALLKAVAIGENEASVVRSLTQLEGKNTKGFVPQKQAMEIEGKFLMLMRFARTPLIDGLNTIFGHKTQISQKPRRLEAHWLKPWEEKRISAFKRSEIF